MDKLILVEAAAVVWLWLLEGRLLGEVDDDDDALLLMDDDDDSIAPT